MVVGLSVTFWLIVLFLWIRHQDKKEEHKIKIKKQFEESERKNQEETF